MTNQFRSYDRILQEYLKGEFRIANVHLPSSRKSLSQLLSEEHPQVICNDGSAHFFKRKELGYLATLISDEEREALFLPILIEPTSNPSEMSVLCQGDLEPKVISKVLNMPVSYKEGRITIFKPQLSLLRKKLRTTSQYVFSPRINE